MGAGASVLQGSLVGVEVRGGEYGYIVTFPPGYFDTSSSEGSDMSEAGVDGVGTVLADGVDGSADAFEGMW